MNVDQSFCRWGILGTANIARKNWQSIHDSGNGTLVAVGSRSAQRAEQFINECQAHVAFKDVPRGCSYEELLLAEDIDAVYIPLPTGMRKEWVIRAAEVGKHILCEKPCGVSAADLAEMIDACRKYRVQFMDGVMFMHSRRLEQLRQTIDDGTSVGKLRRLASHFSFQAPDDFLTENIRVNNEMEPLGCLGDLGWYNIRFALWVMNYQMPRQVTGRTLTATAAGVPLEFSAELLFEDGVSASFYNSFLTENQQWAVVSGDKGFIRLADFVLPFCGSEVGFEVTNAQFQTHGCQFDMQPNARHVSIAEPSNNQPASQEANLFHNFGELALANEVNDHWPELALKTQIVLDACFVSAQEESRLVEIA